MEPFSDDLTGIGDQQERVRRIFFDKVTQTDRFYTIQRSKDNILIFTAERSLGFYDGCAPVELLVDVVADWLR